jgi:hypothetical protein
MMTETTCGRVESCCECTDDAGHDGAHHCSCGGSWIYDDDGFRPLTFPGGDPASLAGMLTSFDRMLGRLGLLA